MSRTESTLSTPVIAADTVVACQRLTKVFKDFWMRDRARAVENLTLEIRSREIFGLLGPNGSGKSTTIKILLGLLRPTSGRVAVFGKPPTDVAVKKRIGYLPEESYLYPFLNARETLDYYGKLFQLDYRTRQRRIDELLDMIGLTNAQFRQVREYSKGMQRRIGIAQALINDPDFLILDEPTTGLDPIGTKQIKDLIIELGRRGKTVLLSSHLLADVEDCVDRMVILYGGQIRAEGTCAELLDSKSRTSIEADLLDDDTVAEIDRVIRSRSGGNRAILRVSRPRQRLEELFLDIVERARGEHLRTSGVMAGGQTAAFLRGKEEGGALIDRLVRAEAGAPLVMAGAVPERAPARAGPDDLVIDTLLTGKGSGAGASMEQAAPKRPAPTPGSARRGPGPDLGGVDQSVIGSLLGENGGQSGATKGSGSDDKGTQGSDQNKPGRAP